jgi:hypothetical protein
MRFLASDRSKMAGFLDALDTLDRMDVATSVATSSRRGSSAAITFRQSNRGLQLAPAVKALVEQSDANSPLRHSHAMPASGRDKRLRQIVIAIVAVGVLVLLGASGIDIGSNDDQFYVAVRNDTSQILTLQECNTYSATCGSSGLAWVLTPHQSATTGQDPDGVFRPMEVLSKSKTVLGCMPFQFSKATAANTAVQITQMVPCGKSLGAWASGGRDWPFSSY